VGDLERQGAKGERRSAEEFERRSRREVRAPKAARSSRNEERGAVGAEEGGEPDGGEPGVAPWARKTGASGY
jgi:hypothetical protein